jgi:hypothetical protein
VDGGADRASQMVALLTPVDAVPDREPATRERRPGVDAEGPETLEAGVREAVCDVVAPAGRPVATGRRRVEIAVSTADQVP